MSKGWRRFLHRRSRSANGSGTHLGVEDLADHGPFPLYLQQMEEIGEREARDVIGVDTHAGGRACDINGGEYRLRFRGRAELAADDFEQTLLNRPAFYFAVAVDTEHGGFLAEGRFHDGTVGLCEAFVVLAHYFNDGFVFLNVGWVAHCVAPDLR